MTDLLSWNNFMKLVSDKVGDQAHDKGYRIGDADTGEDLLKVTGDDHAIGEIIYKAVRFRAKKNQDDLVKIAAWAFLLWRKNKPLDGDDLDVSVTEDSPYLSNGCCRCCGRGRPEEHHANCRFRGR